VETIYTDGTYLKNNPNWHLSESDWKAAKVRYVIKKNNLKLANVCDVGCGYGKVLKLLSENLDMSCEYTGFDISPDAIKYCSQIPSKNITFCCKNILEDDVYFDLVMALDVVEHVEDYFDFLKGLRTKGKYKLFHIPLGLFVLKVLFPKGFLVERRDHGHIHYFNKEIVFAVFKETGYKIVDWEYLPKRLSVPNPGKLASFLRLPRKIMFAMHKDSAARIIGGFSLSILAE
jgi:SAM-dependent methyltransferase